MSTTHPTAAVVKSLKDHAKTLAKVKRTDLDTNHPRYYETHQILHAVMDLAARYRGPERIRAWIDRKPYRAKLLRLQRAPYSKEGQRAIADLFALVISSVETDRPFRPEVNVKDLPMPKPRKLTESQLANLAKGWEAQAERRAELDENVLLRARAAL